MRSVLGLVLVPLLLGWQPPGDPPGSPAPDADAGAPAPEPALEPTQVVYEPVPELRALPANDCPTYCTAMDQRCPDVFLGNYATCLRTCGLYPAGTADAHALGCLIYGADDGELVEAVPAAPEVKITSSKVIVFDDHPQLWSEGSVIPEGYGAVFFPAIGLYEREPIVAVSQGGQVVADGPAGRRIVLPPGEYEARLGNGNEAEQIVHDVTVVKGHTTVIDADWAALEVAVVDPQFIPFRGSYELIRSATRSVVGIGFGADAFLGERLGVWILPAGLYRLVQPGGTYRDRTNFSTVRLTPGQVTRFVLVQDPETGDLKGAGELDPSQLTTLGNWLIRGVIGGDFNFNHVRDLGWTLITSLFVDAQITYDRDPHSWSTRLDVAQAGEFDSQRVDTDRNFLIREDRFYINSIYIYSLVPWFGPYVRADMNAQITRRNEIDQFPNATNPQVGGPFSPMDLSQGVGGNFRVWRTRDAELNLRVGAGTRQVIPNGLQFYDPDTETLSDAQLAHTEGVEGAAVGFARFSRYVTINTTFDGQVPVTGTSTDPIFQWRSQVGFRLASFASLNYRLNMELNSTKMINETLVVQDIQLRFSYAIF